MHLPWKNVNVWTVHKSLTGTRVFTLKCHKGPHKFHAQWHLLHLPSCGSTAQVNYWEGLSPPTSFIRCNSTIIQVRIFLHSATLRAEVTTPPSVTSQSLLGFNRPHLYPSSLPLSFHTVVFPISQFNYFLLEGEVHSDPDQWIKDTNHKSTCKTHIVLQNQLKGANFQFGTWVQLKHRPQRSPKLQPDL